MCVIYMSIHTYIHTYIYACIYTARGNRAEPKDRYRGEGVAIWYTRVNTHKYIDTYDICISHICIYVCTYMHSYIYKHTYICIRIYMYTRYMHISIYTRFIYLYK